MQHPVKQRIAGEQDNIPGPRIHFGRRVRDVTIEGIDKFGAEYALGVLVACAVSIMDHTDMTFRKRVLKYMAERLGVSL